MKERKEARRKYLNILITLYCAHVCIHYVNISLYFDAFIIINCIFCSSFLPYDAYMEHSKKTSKREKEKKKVETQTKFCFSTAQTTEHT